TWVTLNWIDIYQAVLQGGKPVYIPTSSSPHPVGGLTEMIDWAKGVVGGAVISGTVEESSADTSEPWCSVAHPSGNCTPIPGVVKALTPEMLNTFKAVQTQANRVAQIKGYTKIGVDGRIGPATVALVNKCLGSSYSSPDNLAASSPANIAYVLQTTATALGAPSSVSSPTPRSPSSAAPGGGVFNPTAPPSFLNEAVSMAMSPIGLLAIGFGIWQYTAGTKTKGRKAKGKGKRSKKSTADWF
ncbi:MAG: hypothetical protein MUQ65_16725, partial [Armatimonadetes bacterium]|nr:hypothetical protein [Armatimonadota bacterium]